MDKLILDLENDLFKRLINNPPTWWANLKKDKDIYIEVRKNNCINIYYNGASILRLSFDKNFNFKGSIHYEYIPLKQEKNYIDYIFDDNSIEIEKRQIEIISLNNFNIETIKRIKKRIISVSGISNEKSIQSNFILNDGYFIDSEFAFVDNDDENSRIDLVRLDTKDKKIVFYELKLIGDSRLFNDDNKNNISNQLSKYYDLIKNNSEILLEYYKKIFLIKKKLGILSNNLEIISDINDYNIIEKPVLIISQCTNEWIKQNSDIIHKKINKYAYGCLLLGSNTYDSSLKNFRNQRIIY